MNSVKPCVSNLGRLSTSLVLLVTHPLAPLKPVDRFESPTDLVARSGFTGRQAGNVTGKKTITGRCSPVQAIECTIPGKLARVDQTSAINNLQKEVQPESELDDAEYFGCLSSYKSQPIPHYSEEPEEKDSSLSASLLPEIDPGVNGRDYDDVMQLLEEDVDDVDSCMPGQDNPNQSEISIEESEFWELENNTEFEELESNSLRGSNPQLSLDASSKSSKSASRPPSAILSSSSKVSTKHSSTKQEAPVSRLAATRSISSMDLSKKSRPLSVKQHKEPEIKHPIRKAISTFQLSTPTTSLQAWDGGILSDDRTWKNPLQQAWQRSKRSPKTSSTIEGTKQETLTRCSSSASLSSNSKVSTKHSPTKPKTPVSRLAATRSISSVDLSSTSPMKQSAAAKQLSIKHPIRKSRKALPTIEEN